MALMRDAVEVPCLEVRGADLALECTAVNAYNAAQGSGSSDQRREIQDEAVACVYG